MSDIFSGRYTVENNKDAAVLIIGMRINKWSAPHKWIPVLKAMPEMIKELYAHKEELGFLSMESYFGLPTTTMIQYWRSTEDLLSYAKNEKHLAAWKHFNSKAGKNSAVGIYHETFQLKAGSYESIYVNMPQYGLSKALQHIPISHGMHSARERLKAGEV
ncbi:DUF4188 domain-containing protein [Bacillus lacus]|uniref:DUF4188 domain-containing protein n=1 Tax=Metabacillus lacus TaxID=1983721 RepID=A0A7X2LYT4_9BACI|nr:DUF4188 domain-containing protein [Metabacillus lacus]MRX71242.1 DUF4188 domain-containing protein [Metabacillus lacus]